MSLGLAELMRQRWVSLYQREAWESSAPTWSPPEDEDAKLDPTGLFRVD